MGMNIIVEMMMEWVRVRCIKPGIMMSMSGISESAKIRGRLTSCLRSFADALAVR